MLRIQEERPTFKENAATEGQDGSRSQRAMRVAATSKRAGLTLEQYRAELSKVADRAEWARVDWQVRRAWDRCTAGFAVDEDDFDDLPRPSGCHVPAFAADGLPDLSHDQPAYKLG